MKRLLAALAALILLTAWISAAPDSGACDTDSDCARFCPAPADDPDCDGGPQS